MTSTHPSRSMAFEEARKNFISKLDGKDAALLDSSAGPEDVLADLQKLEKEHEESSILRGVMERIEPCVSGVEQYAKAMDVICNVKPEVLSLLWGGLRIVLRLAKDFLEIYKKLVDILSKIGRQLGMLKAYSHNYPKSERLQESLRSSYVAYLTFCSSCRTILTEAHSKRSAWHKSSSSSVMKKLLLKPFKEEFTATIEQLQRSFGYVTEEADLAEKQEASLARLKAAERTQSEEHRALYDWLDPADPDRNYQRAVDLHEEHTGQWIFSTDEFKEWYGKSGGGFCWLHAKPGAGKTVMASTIIAHLKEQRQHGHCLYHFCDYKDFKTQHPRKVVQTLIAQMCRASPKVLTYMSEFSKRFINSRLWCSDSELSTVFTDCMKMLGPVYTVIDALDESSERTKLIELLLKISASTTEVNIFVTSREESDIKEKLSDLPNMSLDNVMSQDIEIFVRCELRRLIDTEKLDLRDRSLEDKIRDTLTSKAEGMFQWVRCQLEVLRNCISDKQIQQCLDTLPRGLDETYVRIFSRIKLHHASDLETVRKTFFWLVNSCRPLTLSELAEAASFEPHQVVMDFSALPTDPKKLLRFTGGLIGVNDKDSTVYLTHYSVKEFLLSPRIQDTDISDFYSGTPEIRSEQAITCLKYLMMQDFDSGQCYTEKQLKTRANTYSFLNYAARFWSDHCHEAGPLENLDLILCDFFTKPQYAQNVLAWQQMDCDPIYHPRKTVSLRQPALNPILHAARHGLSGLLRRLQALGYDIDDHCGHIRSPLLMAIRSRRSNWHCVGAMLDMGANVRMEDSGVSVAPAIADLGGPDQLPLLERVINLGADVHDYSEYGVNPINVLESISARPFDPVGVISSLLQKGADLNKHYMGPHRYYWRGPPLQQACFAGNIKIVKLLLDGGALVDYGDCKMGTPLEAAILGGSTPVVDLLLDFDVTNNSNILHNGSPLYAAVLSGRLGLVRLLISRGVNVNQSLQRYGSLLNFAIASKRHDIIHLLLQEGASANVEREKEEDFTDKISRKYIFHPITEPEYRTRQPINYAMKHELSDVVLKLIDKGANLNAIQGHRCDSFWKYCAEIHPLCFAVQLGRNDYAELLMSRGANPANARPCVMLHAGHGNNDGFLEKALEVMPEAFMDEEIVLDMLKNCTNQAFYQAVTNLIGERKAQLPGPGSLALLLIDSSEMESKLFKIPWILEYGIDINMIPDESNDNVRTLAPGQALLPLSIYHKMPELFDMLLTRNADPNDYHKLHGTPLAAAFGYSDWDAMKRLFQHGADPNVCWPNFLDDFSAKDELCRRQCLVHRVAAQGSTKIMQLLLENGADLSRPGSAYASPLWAAVVNENVDMIHYLIQQRADMSKRNMYGKSLLTWARDNHRCKATISVLEEHSTLVSKRMHDADECSQRLEETVKQITDYFLRGEHGEDILQPDRPVDIWVILGRCLTLGHDDHNAIIALERSTRYPNDNDLQDVPLKRFHLCKDAETMGIKTLHSLERHEMQLSQEGRLKDHEYLMYPRPFLRSADLSRIQVTISEGKYMPRTEWLKSLQGWKVNKQRLVER